MSFGYGVGDFLAVGQLCWKVYKKCKDSPGNYVELSSEVGALHNVIKETEELLSQQNLTSEQEVKLVTCRQGCEDVLKDLDALLLKYESLGTKSRRTFDRTGFGMHDMNGIRSRLISNVSMLDAFNDTSSHARLENKLNLLIAEVRAGKREGSVISTQTFDTTARNDQETWEALRRELEDVGISSYVITEKRQFIIAWFREAVAAGKLEEDALSDDNDSAISLYKSDGPARRSDDDAFLHRGISSMTIEPRTIQRSTTRESVPDAPHLSGQPADISYPPRPPPRERTSRLRVTYFLNKLQGREGQFFEAARAGDVRTIENLLKNGVDIQVRGYRRDTALHVATHRGKEEAVRLLLSKGAAIYAKNNSGKTALHQAADHGNEDIVRLLLEEGADIESQSSTDGTALICAATQGQKAVVQLLLEKGATFDVKDAKGQTALFHAGKLHDKTVARLLRRAGARR